MKLRELLQQMTATYQKLGTSEPFICGGTPRDRYLKHLENISDLDITAGDKTIDYLSQEFYEKLSENYNVTRRVMDDGHSSINIGSFKMDFSSNFNTPNIAELLVKQGITKPTEMQKEMFSRDFTCNALLLSLDLKKLTDPTGKGFKDIKDRTIRTCLDPSITLVSNKNRVVRAIYLAAKLDFDIDNGIINFIKKNPSSIKISTTKSLTEKLNEAFNRDADKASYYLSKMDLWGEIPITESIRPYYMKHVNAPQKLAYFQGGGGVNDPAPKKKKYKSEPALVVQPRFKEPFYHNYDTYDIPGFEHIGPGAGWHSMQKYKSVAEFLKAKRKKLKDKYKADDSWKQDDGSITKSPNKIKTRANLLAKLTKTAIDFSVDEYFENNNINSENNSPMENANLTGGYLDKYLPQHDFEGKSPETLDFGRDYCENEQMAKKSPKDLKSIEKLLEKYLSHGLYGLPDGVDLPEEDLINPKEINPYYGTLDNGNTTYEDKWNI